MQMRRRKQRSALWMAFWIISLTVAALGLFMFLGGYRALVRTSFPEKYGEIIEIQAKENGLDPALVYAVIKVESNFNPHARSHAGAIGLMQMMPETFEWLLQKNSEEENLTQDDLEDPQVNIRYGCMLLGMLLDKYEDIEVALCAYNAGIGNTDKWLMDEEYSSDGKTLQMIPFKETRRYVNHVMQYQETYHRLYEFQ